MVAALRRRNDPSSFSNPASVCAHHALIDWDVDFEARTISGSVKYDVKVVEQVSAGDEQAFLLDTHNLVISGVEVEGVKSRFIMRPGHEIFGSALIIPLRKGTMETSVKISYHTTPQSTAVQWLQPEATAGGKHPYLFTQCQAIHARSLLPCQDSPSAKITYEATVRVPHWATCLMSALPRAAGDGAAGTNATSQDQQSCKEFFFKQPVPMSSYLVAMAVGDLEGRDISERCRIWAEPSVVGKAAYDFAQTEEFLRVAEDLTCPYQWGRYDVLCLPPSFPYGGMENPCLTFVTPTLLAGDRSLAGVIAHEISHSWTGNLVTNVCWSDFWLNEGWTMWLERKIMSRVLEEPRYFDFDAQIGWNHLKEDVEHFESAGKAGLTALCPDLEGVDPDDAFSSCPYEKGFALLYELQGRVGLTEFEEFARAYIAQFKFGLIDSETFRDFFIGHFGAANAALKGLDWDFWFHAPGLPSPAPKFDDTLCTASWSLADEWLSEQKAPADPRCTEFAGWASSQRVVFLERLLANTSKMTTDMLSALDDAYGLTVTGNSEIRFRWHLLCLRSGGFFIAPHVLDFLSSQGRMKFTRPLYRELAKHQETRSMALSLFMEKVDFYHPICRQMVAKDLGLESWVQQRQQAKDPPQREGQEESVKKGLGGKTLLVAASAAAAVSIIALAAMRMRRGR
jgi:leukotriene-A4 hydrolase